MADLNVKNVPAELVERLTEQAKQEGMSMQEWLRRTLASRARALTPTELAEIRARNAPDATTAEAFLAWQRRQR